jgi:nucleotide-binding universal stress UspA family protein
MKILVGYDGSNVAKEALALARKHAKTFAASVDIVTSMTKGTESEREGIEKAERGLEYAKGLFIEENISCNTHLLIRGLSPGEDIVEFAKENIFVDYRRVRISLSLPRKTMSMKSSSVLKEDQKLVKSCWAPLHNM